jgi:capsular exopolysaccharide synthesis family protein
MQIFINIISKKLYKIEIDGDHKNGINIEFGKPFIAKGFNFTLKLRDPDSFIFDSQKSNKYYFYFESPENMANNYIGRLNANPIEKDATLVTLSVSGSVPRQEIDYLNKLMDLYIRQGLEFKNQIADSTIKFIDQQLGTVSDSLKKTENNLADFKFKNKLINLSSEGNLIQSRLEKFSNEKITLELQKKYYEYLLRYLYSKSKSGDIIAPYIMEIADQSLNKMVQDLATLQQQEKRLSMNYIDGLPPINLLEESISTARKALVENAENGLSNINQSLKEVEDRINIVDLQINKLPETDKRMINIQRKFDINNTVYTYLLEKRAETGIARASNVSDNRIIDRADKFNSVIIRPKTRQNYILALILSFFFPGFCIYIIDYLNNKIIDKKDIEQRTRAPIIGYVSHNETKSDIPVNDKPGSILSESFRSIRTSIRYFIKDTEHPVIAVTSTISSEGKTFISLNLAAITAMLGKKVLLIGLDLRKPRINKVFEVSNSEGMSTYLSGNCDFEAVIKKTSVDNLYYASSGPVPPNPAELIESIKMKTFIERSKKEFDIIIIDTPPIAIVTDALLINEYVDLNIFVVRQRYSSRNTLDLIQELYQAGKLKNIGIIINDISLSGYYGYGLRYGYYTGYGYSYGNNYYGKYINQRYGYSDKGSGYYYE